MNFVFFFSSCNRSWCCWSAGTAVARMSGRARIHPQIFKPPDDRLCELNRTAKRCASAVVRQIITWFYRVNVPDWFWSCLYGDGNVCVRVCIECARRQSARSPLTNNDVGANNLNQICRMETYENAKILQYILRAPNASTWRTDMNKNECCIVASGGRGRWSWPRV